MQEVVLGLGRGGKFCGLGFWEGGTEERGYFGVELAMELYGMAS